MTTEGYLSDYPVNQALGSFIASLTYGRGAHTIFKVRPSIAGALHSGLRVGEDEMKASGLWLRSLAAVVDSSIVFFFWYFIIETWGTTTSGTDKTLTGLPAILLMLATAAYWILPEWLAGATFGKWACDLRVISTEGSKLSFSQSVKRNVLRLIDFFPFYLVGFITAKLTPNHQRLGDLWAKTIVAKRSEVTREATAMPSSTNSSSAI